MEPFLGGGHTVEWSSSWQTVAITAGWLGGSGSPAAARSDANTATYRRCGSNGWREFRWSRYWPLEPFPGGANHVLREGLVREVGVEDTVGHLRENVKSLTRVASTQERERTSTGNRHGTQGGAD